jgi:hypothetical protein
MAIKPGSGHQAEQIRTVRRILMQCLNQSYPAKQFVKTLFNKAIYIEPTYDKGLFVKDIFYLQDKGYLRITENILMHGCELFEKFIVLSADGKEVADQTMVDEALEI